MQKRILVTLHTTCGSVGQGWLDYGSKILWDMEPEKEIKAAILSRVDAQTLDVLELVKIDGDAWRALEINKGLHRLLETTEVVEVDSRSETVPLIAPGVGVCTVKGEFDLDHRSQIRYTEPGHWGHVAGLNHVDATGAAHWNVVFRTNGAWVVLSEAELRSEDYRLRAARSLEETVLFIASKASNHVREPTLNC